MGATVAATAHPEGNGVSVAADPALVE
jgi:hypothetical protein